MLIACWSKDGGTHLRRGFGTILITGLCTKLVGRCQFTLVIFLPLSQAEEIKKRLQDAITILQESVRGQWLVSWFV